MTNEVIGKKIGVLSDSHGSINPQIIDLMNECDIVIHAGDIIDDFNLEKIKPKEKLIAVRGNNDAHLKQFTDCEYLEIYNKKIVIEHGHRHGWEKPSHESLRKEHADADIVIYGHTHKQVIEKDQTPWIINPGASGPIRNYDGPKCIVINANEIGEWQINPYIFREILN